jgi:hypothetical protein
VAEIGIGDFTVTRERFDVVAFIDALDISRYDTMFFYIL